MHLDLDPLRPSAKVYEALNSGILVSGCLTMVLYKLLPLSKVNPQKRCRTTFTSTGALVPLSAARLAIHSSKRVYKPQPCLNYVTRYQHGITEPYKHQQCDASNGIDLFIRGLLKMLIDDDSCNFYSFVSKCDLLQMRAKSYSEPVNYAYLCKHKKQLLTFNLRPLLLTKSGGSLE